MVFVLIKIIVQVSFFGLPLQASCFNNHLARMPGKSLKTIFAYFFLLLILWPSWKMGLVWAWFKANQSYIAQELCTNKDRPELTCNGKCFYFSVVKELNTREHDDFVNGLANLLNKDLVYVFQTTVIKLPRFVSGKVPQLNFSYQHPHSGSFLLTLIKPPAIAS